MIIVEKESFMSTIPIQKTLSKEELYTLIQNYQKNHDQKSKEMIILSNTKLVLSLMKRFYQKSNQNYEALLSVKKGLDIDPTNKIGLELLEKILYWNY